MANVKAVLDGVNKKYDLPAASIGIHYAPAGRIPTGIFQLDLSIGGGIPIGKTSMVYGPESSAKTSIALLAIASAQRMWPDKTAVFVDVEHALDKKWAAKLGVDVDKMGYVLPDTSEQVVDIVEGIMYAEDISVLVVDSLAAMTPQKELEEGAEKDLPGRSGILINRLYRKVTVAHGIAQKKGLEPTVILINQIRSKIGVLYGSPESVPGGKAFLFASALTVRVYGKDKKEQAKDVLPSYKEVNFIIKKWKVEIVATNGTYLMATRPVVKYNLLPGQSYDWNTILRYLKEYGLFVKSKTWDLIDGETGEVLECFNTQDELQQKIHADRAYGDKIRGMIVNTVLEKGDVLESQ